MNDKDRSLLTGMLDFAQRVSRRTANLTNEMFMADSDMQDAILYALGQLGEKANGLSSDFIEKYPSEEWYSLIGLRNRLFHSYDDINLDMVYDMAKNDIDSIIVLIGDLVR